MGTMQVKTCFRELSSEGLYGTLNADLKADFFAEPFYQRCLQTGPEWREWEGWIRAEVVNFLVTNGLVDPTAAEAQDAEVKANKAAGISPPVKLKQIKLGIALVGNDQKL